MNISSFNPALRSALDLPTGTPLDKHPSLIEAAKTIHPHSVTLLDKLDQYSTCGMYALGLIGDSAYESIAGRRLPNLFAGKAFYTWLMAGKLIALPEPSDECLALYSRAGEWSHVAIVDGRTARSKWGTFPVYRHPLQEVPASYGDTINFYEMPKPGDGLKLFVEFAHTR